jgi:putative toxin-antitoxin system antitoxin component (TIGR02293 family)
MEPAGIFGHLAVLFGQLSEVPTVVNFSAVQPVTSNPGSLPPLYQLAVKYLGGRSVLGRKIQGEIQAHALISEGMPTRAMLSLAGDLQLLTLANVLLVIGISQRNFRRRKEAAERDPHATLTVDEGSRLWKFTEILAQATQTLGSQERAEAWLSQPQVGLEGKRPVELLTTAPGAQLVEELLLRMEYGVYT